MPEYLSPGVYIEEIEIGPKTIEGVSTSTVGFLGQTERGSIRPTLITSFEAFTRNFGGFLNNSFLAYAVDGFFRNGGKRCYVSRIVKKFEGEGDVDINQSEKLAKKEIEAGAGKITLYAVGPGMWGNRLYYDIKESNVHKDDNQYFDLTIYYFSKDVSEDQVNSNNFKPEKYGAIIESVKDVSIKPTSNKYYKNELNSLSHLVWADDDLLNFPEGDIEKPADTEGKEKFDIEQFDEEEIEAIDYDGETIIEIKENVPLKYYSGIKGLEKIDDISIVCAPENATIEGLPDKIIQHCEDKKDRFAIIDANRNPNFAELFPVRDSKYAAVYTPWLYVYDILTNNKKLIPPSGHMAGIYARSDTERGVHYSPANLGMAGVIDLQQEIDKRTQDIINPKGINAIRKFPGRGNIVWGARTMSSDPMWKYISVRRLFIFIEKSVERSTQWAVFEPNNQRLWSRIRTTLIEFLKVVWRDGALMGETPEEAFFVKCDSTVMTQNDFDNGRLIVIVGLAVVKPAEFVIFRFAQTPAGTQFEEL